MCNYIFPVVFETVSKYISDMMRGVTFTVGLMTGFVLSGSTTALALDSSDQPYGTIVSRNLFALKPPEKTAEEEAAKGPPPPKITLNGIASILGRLQVLFKASVSAKQGEPAKDVSFVLSEGERENDIEVLEIDETVGTVKFNNHGAIQTLNLEKDGAKPALGAGGSGAPPPGTSPVGANTGSKTIPQRMLRIPSTAPNPPPETRAEQSSQSAPTQPPSLPAATTSQATVPTTATVQSKQLSPEEQYILMKAEEEHHNKLRQNDPNLPPMPPVPPMPSASSMPQ